MGCYGDLTPTSPSHVSHLDKKVGVCVCVCLSLSHTKDVLYMDISIADEVLNSYGAHHFLYHGKYWRWRGLFLMIEMTLILSKFYANFSSKCRYYSFRIDSKVNLAICNCSDIVLLHDPRSPGDLLYICLRTADPLLTNHLHIITIFLDTMHDRLYINIIFYCVFAIIPMTCGFGLPKN